MTATETTIDILHALLRGELAAMAAYQQALELAAGETQATELLAIQRAHREAAEALRQQLSYFGGTPESGASSWGIFAKAIGQVAALRVLHDGETQALRDYEEALEDETLPGECGLLIRATLLPQAHRHLETLERLLEAE